MEINKDNLVDITHTVKESEANGRHLFRDMTTNKTHWSDELADSAFSPPPDPGHLPEESVTHDEHDTSFNHDAPDAPAPAPAVDAPSAPADPVPAAPDAPAPVSAPAAPVVEEAAKPKATAKK